MPVNLDTSLTLSVIEATSWAIRSIHYEGLDHNSAARVVVDCVYFNAEGFDCGTKRLECGLLEMAAKYPELYATLKQAHYAEAVTMGMPAGSVE